MVTVAAVQAAPILMDRDATIAKAVGLIHEAASQGAKLIVFPEVYIPGTPVWFDSNRIWDDDEHTTLKLHVELMESAKTTCLTPQQHDAQLSALVTYGTDDGRLSSYDTKGSLETILDDSGHVQSLNLYVFDYLACVDAHDDALPYKLSPCSTLDHVELRLDITYLATDHTTTFANRGLTARETDRDPTNASNGGERTRVLALTRVAGM